ncbi:hypothetical protein N7466_001204 [Penicillium verhagenii]|uniref:uncharacterized protein n=1 Tax=Penicillium verhagenii TaxID=1562060 RepID=UPI0025451CA8|nr:uncharacterized protein N7466_001204 [Penicillium verhagenii]KAJ5948189.1 hypothetical protein N7466_001204 [Penicillium verhagenii]
MKGGWPNAMQDQMHWVSGQSEDLFMVKGEVKYIPALVRGKSAEFRTTHCQQQQQTRGRLVETTLEKRVWFADIAISMNVQWP